MHGCSYFRRNECRGWIHGSHCRCGRRSSGSRWLYDHGTYQQRLGLSHGHLADGKNGRNGRNDVPRPRRRATLIQQQTSHPVRHGHQHRHVRRRKGIARGTVHRHHPKHLAVRLDRNNDHGANTDGTNGLRIDPGIRLRVIATQLLACLDTNPVERSFNLHSGSHVGSTGAAARTANNFPRTFLDCSYRRARGVRENPGSLNHHRQLVCWRCWQLLPCRFARLRSHGSILKKIMIARWRDFPTGTLDKHLR